MQGKEPERSVAALRSAEGDAALREKSHRNGALMFGISIRPATDYYRQGGLLRKRIFTCRGALRFLFHSTVSRISTQSQPLPQEGGTNSDSDGGTMANNLVSPVLTSNHAALTAFPPSSFR